MGKSRSKGASKGKRYTRRRVKGGSKTPRDSNRSEQFGFPSSSIIPKIEGSRPKTLFSNPNALRSKPKTLGSAQEYGFNQYINLSPREDDIDIDATVRENPDMELNYSEIMALFSEVINKLLEDKKQEVENIDKAKPANNKNLNDELNEIKLNLAEWERMNTDFNKKILYFRQITKDKKLNKESDYLDSLTDYVRLGYNQFSKINISIIVFLRKYKDIIKKGDTKPWWKFNITKKKSNKTGVPLINKIRAATGVNKNEAEEIAKLLKKSEEQITNKAIKSTWATLNK